MFVYHNMKPLHYWVKVREIKPTIHKTWACPYCGNRITTRQSGLKFDVIANGISVAGLMKQLNIPEDCSLALVQKVQNS